MNEAYARTLAAETGMNEAHVSQVISLLDEGATVPFIARYRKERTGMMDETKIAAIRDGIELLCALAKRREAIISSLKERELLAPEIERKIAAATTLAALEDLYLPFRPKRRTRATIAQEKGLEQLAKIISEQSPEIDPEKEAAKFINPDKDVETAKHALAGARDIIAEQISENPELRRVFRNIFLAEGRIISKLARGHKDPEGKYRDYHSHTEPVSKIASHRISAVFRGENEKILSVTIEPAMETAIAILERRLIRNSGKCADQYREALIDGYKRLLAPAIETETRKVLKQRADSDAIKVFADNLKNLLMAPPLGQKAVMAIDPGIRTGCKLVCLDRQGKLLHHDVVYIFASTSESDPAAEKIRSLCTRFNIEAIAVGNGTGGREAESFFRNLNVPGKIPVFTVNESGASIYSASECARKEFPDHDLTVRGAVSIGRRLMDPLSELVKLDPKTIGVGQYQHDVDQVLLKKSLDDVVISCVNSVGVDLNSAGPELLSYVSGLGEVLAKNIVNRRNIEGPYADRAELLQVARLGPKAFQQAAGFLRIKNANNPLDESAVHPEAYSVVQKMAEDLGYELKALIGNDQLISKIDVKRYITEEIGINTLRDILAELSKPGRDPRPPLEEFAFCESIKTINDLSPGQILPGIITNVTKFGAFVDIGVHQDGLVHISQLSDKFVKDPASVVRVQQKVTVTVIEVDVTRRRISLSMKGSAVIRKPDA